VQNPRTLLSMPANTPTKKTISPTNFSRQLVHWHTTTNDRQMPWKGEKDPYKIWLSEIILQQTRVEQGLAYYQRFIAKYPTVIHLAQGKEDAVMKLWEGLGYYSRCRNLLVAARFIVNELKGVFPNKYESILQLKGVGPYTAAAIASFGFNLPYAVVDGNVFRVLARVFGIHTPIDSTEGKKQFNELAQQLLDKKQAGLYNQAIMDFGATVCKPATPLCYECPFQKNCVAFRDNVVSTLPVKSKKLKIKKRWFYYLVLKHKNELAIQSRTAKDIWQGLHEFPMIETNKATTIEKIKATALEKGLWPVNNSYQLVNISPIYKQALSHQLIEARFIEIVISQKPIQTSPIKWVLVRNIGKYAFPQIINQYLKAGIRNV
jgi:A/G-specific adenine glycosylase